MNTQTYLITHNNPEMTLEEYMMLWKPHVNYINMQLERGETGTVHIQAYVHLKKRSRLAALKKIDKLAHYEPVKKDNGASAYCMKEETRIEGPLEHGKRPLSPASKTDWEEIRTQAREGRLDEVDAGIYVRYYNSLKRIEKDHMKVTGEADDCKGIWIYGPSGVGKSRYARDNYPEAYKKLANKWWDGYQGETHVLLEDLDPNHACLGYHLKIWADRYHAPGETKGGQVPLTFEKILVTS